MKKLLFGILAAWATVSSAETIAHWTFGEKGLADVSGHGHALVANNVAFGETGYATLNGTNAWLETAETLDLTAYGQVTVECWIKPETMIGEKADFGPLFLHQTTSGGTSVPGSFVTYFATGADERSFRSQLRDSSDKWTLTKVLAPGTAPLPYLEGGWHHVALVMDITGNETWSGKSKLFVDGERQAGTESAMTATVHKFLNLKMIFGGGGEYVPGRFFRGQLDDIRVSSGCLTPDQFLKFPTVGKCQSVEKPALAFWPFGTDELKDKTGNGFDLAPTSHGSGAVSFGDGAAHFPGTKGLYMPQAFPAHAFSQSGLTYEFFFRTTSDLSDIAVLLETSANYGNGSGRFHLRLKENRATTAGVLRTTDGYNTSLAGADDAKANDGEWHHVALVYDPKSAGAARLRVYQDGTLLAKNPAEVSDNLTHLDGACSLFFGSRGGAEYFHVGEMDDVRVMPWALKPEEFLKTRTVREPLAHWKFDKAETALTDLTGNGHALVSQNGVTFQDGYASFNGQNANLITAAAIDLSHEKQLTVEGNFWLEDVTKLNVLFDTDDTATPGGFVVYAYQEQLLSQYRVKSGTWQQHLKTGVSEIMGAWHHVAFVVNVDNQNTNQSQIWLDGVKLDVNPLSSACGAMTSLLNTKLSFGGGGAYGRWCWDANKTSFKGRISEVVVTAAELTPSTFRLLAKPDEKEEIVRPVAIPLESVELDLAGKQDVTVECYAKLTAESAGQLFAFGYAEGVKGTTFALDAQNGKTVASAWPSTGGSNVETAAIPADGNWHHYALVIDGYAQGAERVRLYVDRVRATTHFANVNWSGCFLKGTLSVGCEALKGKISSVRVSTGVLPVEEFMSERKFPGLMILVR